MHSSDWGRYGERGLSEWVSKGVNVSASFTPYTQFAVVSSELLFSSRQ